MPQIRRLPTILSPAIKSHTPQSPNPLKDLLHCLRPKPPKPQITSQNQTNNDKQLT